VDLKHVTNKIDELVKLDDNLRVFESQLLSKEYLDGVAEEVNQVLQEAGQMPLQEIAKKYAFTTPFLDEILRPRLGTFVQGRVDNGILYTQAYIQRQTALIRGVLSAVTRPTVVSQLLSTYKIQESLFNTVVADLIKAGRVAGSIQSREWVPDVFAREQESAVRRFLDQNGYIEYSFMERMEVSAPKSFLRDRLKAKGTALSAIFLSDAVSSQVESAVDEAISSGTWTCLMQLLPPIVPQRDAQRLLQTALDAKGREGNHMVESVDSDGELCFVPAALLDKVAAAVQKHAEVHSDKLHQLLVATVQPPAEEDPRDGAAEGRGRGGKGKKGRRGEEEEEPVPEVIEAPVKGQKKREKGMGGREKHTAKKKEKPAAAAAVSSTARTGSGGKKGAMDAATDAALMAEVSAAVRPVLVAGSAGHDLPDGLEAAVVARFRGAALSAFEKAAHSIFVTGNKTAAAAIQGPFTAAKGTFDLFLKGARALELSGAETVALERLLLKRGGGEIAALLVSGALKEAKVADAPEVTALSSPEARLAVLPQCGSHIRPLLIDLEQAMAPTKKTVDDFASALDIVCRTMGLQQPLALDKNKERGALHQHKLQWNEELAAATDAGVVILLVLQLLVLHTRKALVHIPWRAAPAVVALLAADYTAETCQLLSRLTTSVSAAREAAGDGSATPAVDLPEEAEGLAAARELVTKEGLATAVLPK